MQEIIREGFVLYRVEADESKRPFKSAAKAKAYTSRHIDDPEIVKVLHDEADKLGHTDDNREVLSEYFWNTQRTRWVADIYLKSTFNEGRIFPYEN